MKLPRTLICLAGILLECTYCVSAVSEEVPSPSFRSDVMAVLSRSGCNQGTCHGNSNGKGGLKLSLRGQNPDKDFLTLTRASGSRRVTLLNPVDSLLLRKPTMVIPHEGGRRFSPGSREYRILHDWIASGLPKDADTAPTMVSLAVSPKHQTLYAPDNSAQLRATALFTDGTERDVTDLAVFSSSATFASVSADGVASFSQPGMTTVTVRYLTEQRPIRLEYTDPPSDFLFKAEPSANPVDQAVNAQLERLRLNPLPNCDDSTFLRRACLDLTGQLPTIDRTSSFLNSAAPDKRARLIDELLASEEFNDFQTLRWADLLRVEVKTLDTKGVEVFHNWIRDSFAQAKPLNQFVAEIISARGSTYEVPEANFYRAVRKPQLLGEATAQVFLGIRLQCAQCHNHPFDRWTQDDYYGWADFFGRIEYEIVENKRRDKNDKNEFVGEQIVKIKESGDVKNPDTGVAVGPRFLGEGPSAGTLESEVSRLFSDLVNSGNDGSSSPDRLQRLARWISDPENNRFAVTQANRIWAQLMGRGIIDPVDDFRSTNPPTNPELLEVLRREFVDHDFDVRHLMRLIMNSDAYQRASNSAAESKTSPAPAWPESYARTEPRRLTAEQTIDGISHVVGSPVAFGGHPKGTKAAQLKGVRNGGHRYSTPEIGDRFLKLFGKPNRLQTCECERSNESTLAQTFEMLSGELISELLLSTGNRIDDCLSKKRSDAETISQFYLAAYCRPPTETELTVCQRHLGGAADRRQALEDILWAILNSNEFLLRQ